MRLNISFSQKNNETICFSANELARCLQAAMADLLISINNQSEPSDFDLSIFLETGHEAPRIRYGIRRDRASDDQYLISIKLQNYGVIAGSNSRSAGCSLSLSKCPGVRVL